MRIRLNNWCNVLTHEHSTAYRSPATPDKVSAQITIPSYRGRALLASEAKALAEALLEAVALVQTGQADAWVKQPRKRNPGRS